MVIRAYPQIPGVRRSPVFQNRMIILASGSPRRAELLGRLYKEFAVIVPHVSELRYADDAALLVEMNARLKSGAVSRDHVVDLVIGADTVIEYKGRILGKPENLESAAAMLLSLSGAEHRVLSGVCVRKCGSMRSWSEVTRVRFRRFGLATVRRYLELVPVLDKAGGYGIQEHGELLVESISGDLNNVIGLPLSSLSYHIQELDYSLKALK